MAALAAERLRAGASANRALAMGVGLVQQTAAEARVAAERVLPPSVRLAARTVVWVSGLPDRRGPMTRSRYRMEQAVADARLRGQATVNAGRADAVAFLRTSLNDGLEWTQKQAVPRIVDSMMPYLVNDVMPRIIEGAMPEIRTRVVPVVIDDLSHDPRIRDLVREQSRGMAGGAAQQVRTTTAAADDRVEAAFRRARRGPAPTGGPAAQPGGAPAAEPVTPPTDEATSPSDTA